MSIFLTTGVNAASVSAEKAREWSEEKGKALISALANGDVVEKYQVLDDLFLNYVDLDHVAQFVMGKYWRMMTPKQREFYVPLFKRYSLALYKSYPLQFDEDTIEYEIVKALEEKDYTLVLANITLKALENSKPDSPENASILVEFRLHEKNGNIMLTDLKIAETSFILTYRNRFADMINSNDGDITWFLEDLETVTVSTERNNQIIVENAVPEDE
ncbi:MAG: ABC transporter substrate-binding protein [Lactobacillaceae bacterium]|jgi:phospholipid transport system substrate-binding protein|nr:ABC transporter substrate-binding protein [Lactobacillaceae bacterium]